MNMMPLFFKVSPRIVLLFTAYNDVDSGTTAANQKVIEKRKRENENKFKTKMK